MNSLSLNFTIPIVALFLFGCARDYEGKFANEPPSYHYPLTSPGAKFGTLPPAVKNTVRSEAGAAEIEDVVTRYEPAGPIYSIYFRNRDLFPPMLVAADGTLLKPDLSVAVGAPQDTFSVVSSGSVTGVKINELPAPALQAIYDREPRAQIANINKETWGDRNIFIITFIDPEHHPRLYVTTDGKILNEGPK